MNGIRRMLGVIYLQTKVAFRNWWIYITVSLLPASYYLVFYLVGGATLSDHVLFGSLVSLTLNVGVVSLPQFLVLARQRRLQEMMVASPVRPVEYMMGFAISRLLFALPGLAVLFGLLLGLDRLSLSGLPVLLPILIITWLVGSMIGFLLGTAIPSLSTVGSVANLVGFLLMLIPPVLYPDELLAPAWRLPARLLPSSAAAFLIRDAAGLLQADLSAYWVAWGTLLVWTVACFLFVTRKARWQAA
jgi:ABC-2 type transport system permease protein